MGARALQLSQGTPPFIPIPNNARISLDISMEELNQGAILLTIRRVLPNGDYQNIPLGYFEGFSSPINTKNEWVPNPKLDNVIDDEIILRRKKLAYSPNNVISGKPYTVIWDDEKLVLVKSQDGKDVFVYQEIEGSEDNG